MGTGKAWPWALLAPAVLLLAVASQAANAQDNPSGQGAKPLPKGKPDKQQGERWGFAVKGGTALGEYAELVKELGLSDEQQIKLAALILSRAVIRRYEGAVGSPRPKGKSKGVAADEPPDTLRLTDAQKAEIKALSLDAAREAHVADEKAKGRGGAAVKLMRAVRDQVLTDQQQNALGAAQLQRQVMARALAGLSAKGSDALRLSDQQLAQIKAICETAANDLGPTADEKVNLETIQRIGEQVQGVLTPEQREEVNRRLEARSAKKGKGGGVRQPAGDKGGKPLGGDGRKGK